MADNFLSDNTENIYVEQEYDNIILVDPNKIFDSDGNIKERLVNHENLVTYVNLEAEVLPRTKLAVGGSPQDVATTVSIAKINFLAPNKGDYFTDGYYQELTGNNSTTGRGDNQRQETLIEGAKNSKPYIKSTITSNGVDAPVNNGLLGIKGVVIKTSTSFIPTVTVTLEDVQGRALFQLGDQSPYAAFVNLPYPPFYLTIKGYYGKAVRYQLNLKKFNARFRAQDGNYEITLEFVGYKFNILNEIEVGSLLATPHMYSSTYSVTIPTNQTQTTNTVETVVAEKGYEKIIQVYNEYKQKGLIPQDFPEMTLAQFLNKIETFETNIIQNYPKANVQPLTDCREYKKILTQYYADVYSQDINSWFSKWVFPKPLIGKEGNKQYFLFKEGFNAGDKESGKNELNSIIEEYAKKLDNCGVLGSKGKSQIKNSITVNDFFVTNFDTNTLNIPATITSITSIPNPQNTPKVVTSLIQRINTVSLKNDGTQVKEPVVCFELFVGKIKIMDNEANVKLGEYETLITEDLSKKFEDDRLGIGFSPTVRNITAIIMASTEGFIRLMDDVHTTAWNKRNNEIRRKVILNNQSSAPSPDSKENINIGFNADPTLESSKEPVYPWPQFFVESSDDKKGKFQLQYVGAPSVILQTGGDNYDVWPEVEFVEEYLKGLTQKFDPPLTQPPTNDNDVTNLMNINAIEFPQGRLAYKNKEELKFFYEIYERQFITSHYTGFFRAANNNKTLLIEAVQNYESQNIVLSLTTGAPKLSSLLKEYDFNSQNYITRLKEFSNDGTGRSYQDFIRDFFVTPYLRNLTENSFSILETWQEGPIPQNSLTEVLEKVKQVLDTTSNDFTIMDTYPFTYTPWTNKNMTNLSQNQYNLVFNTDRTLTIYNPRNVIASFKEMTNYDYARPVTNFNYQYASGKSILIPRLNAKDLLPTEGFASNSVTSMLNTPYFVNAILEGVKNAKQKNRYPYKAAAYLFLNSLPLISLKEQLKTKKDGSVYENDYMFAVLKKFGAIHKLPYAWILKIGSIWHRYKTFIETNVDIISESWKDFDYLYNYDPVTKNPEKQYSYELLGQNVNIQMSSNNSNTYNTEVGFYPKVINDFNYFYNGTDLFTNYNNDEIQIAVNKGLKITNLTNSNITNISGGNFKLNLTTWSVMNPVEDIIIDIKDCAPQVESRISSMLVFPSFGSNQNGAFNKVQRGGVMNTSTSFNGNTSIFNGSCRLYWGAPNVGYFDTTGLKKPLTTEYLNSVELKTDNVAPFRILKTEEEYSNIEEIFSVFDKRILDSFEKEFLNFTKKDTDISIAVKTTISYSGVVSNADLYRNFQSLLRDMMKVPPKIESQTEDSYFNNSISKQHEVLQSTISSFLNYDVIFRYGNPMNYKERIFNSFISKGTNTDIVQDPIDFGSYVKNTLPSNQGTITLSQSKTKYPKEWKELELQVGYSTIQGMRYSDNGSYITDFFIDNNINFTVDNIVLLSQLIKIYATQKLKNSSITTNTFVSQLRDFNTTTSDLQDNLLNGVLSLVRKNLPNQETSVETKFNSVVDGDVNKVDTYEKLKALNDKWIAGGDFNNRTYFEDILFLDRASRNIGDILFVDIFKIKNMLRKSAVDSNLSMSVYTLLAGLLIDNNFVIMNLPAYVNFYNVQNTDNIGGAAQENNDNFANNLWGTFLSVDYSKASPKMVCFYAGKPSQYLDLPENKYYRFRSDGTDLTKTTNNLIEEQTKKLETDYEKSNRCVGFTVDIGIRNQNVFQSFTVGQDNGKATAEVINTTYNLASQASGVNVATQSTGLYNLYKQRSYSCDIQMLGNAMIQPTMYFNLRHVPMFNGSYMIQEVTQTISPGLFTTSIKGIRQSMFDLPQIDKYLQSLNRNLLTKLENLVRTNKNNVPTVPITDQQKVNNTQSGSNSNPVAPNSCTNSVIQVYLNNGFVPTETVETQITPQELYNTIQLVSTKFGENANLVRMIYSFCYVTNFKNGQFFAYNNNISTPIDLTKNFSPTYETFFDKSYCCISENNSGQNQTIPLPTFKSLENSVAFIYNRLKDNVNRADKEGLWKYYCCDYPVVNRITSSEFEKQKTTNDGFQKIFKKLAEGVSSMAKLGISVSNIDEILTGKTKTSVVKKTNEPECPPPVIISWEPKTADYNSVSPEIRISGTSLWGNGKTQVSLSGTNCTIKVNNEKLLIIVPKQKVNGKIKITTKYGSVETKEDFIFTNLPTTTG